VKPGLCLFSFSKAGFYVVNCHVVFYIQILHDRKPVRLKVEWLEEINGFEKYRINARNKTFVLQSNRPLLRSKGLKHRRADWKVTEGGFNNQYILNNIIKEIESKVE
jgi:hypothetical protein